MAFPATTNPRSFRSTAVPPTAPDPAASDEVTVSRPSGVRTTVAVDTSPRSASGPTTTASTAERAVAVNVPSSARTVRASDTGWLTRCPPPSPAAAEATDEPASLWAASAAPGGSNFSSGTVGWLERT